ncbi:MAG: hypothetical protein IPJ41_09045 [Phycisphaerales bacterium]|nr:hypothetical protein [Phycisphaerales bacterium]
MPKLLWVCLTLGALGMASPPAQAQDVEAESAETADPVEAYLRDRRLDALLSTYLLDELRAASPSDRGTVAERLGKHYSRLLSAADTPERQREIESQAKQLLDLVPDADSFELRLTLYKASFLLSESVAQRFSLRLSTAEEQNSALETFRAVEPAFLDIGRRIDRRVESLEQMESRATRGDVHVVRDQLADARRLRSLAMYYAGWSQYYQSLISGDPRKAEAARRSFGWLLNAPGNREPTVDGLPTSLLRYEHVARAAMACALAYSLTGQDATAIQWLDAIDAAGETAPEIREELWGRRIEVLARARRWVDLERLIDRRRLSSDPAKATPLPVPEARLIAVCTLEAIQGPDNRPGLGKDRDKLLEAIAQVALGDLVAQGEIGHVLDLVKRFGTSPMGDTGFVVLYVRALRSYERAREAHEAVGGGDEPTKDATVTNRYLDAVRALDVAQAAPDAPQFPKEFVQAKMMQGLALYYAGELRNASAAFQSVFERAETVELREESLWYAIVSLDRAVENGERSAVEDRDKLATLYLFTFPATDRAAKLLLRRIDDGLMSDEEAIKVLLDVPKDSPLYEASRRHASRLMYRQYRSTRGPERDYAAARFVEVAEELINLDVAKVRSGSKEEAQEAAKAVVLRVRQALDAALSIAVPDVARATRLLDLLDDTAALTGLDLGDAEGEIAFRRLQIALARTNPDGVSAAIAELHRAGGIYATSGDRLLYQQALERWKGQTLNIEAATEVVGYGQRVLAQFEPLEDHTKDASVMGVLNTVASAATAVWSHTPDDTSMRDIAIEADKKLVSLGKQTAPSLRRLAVASEAAGNHQVAFDSWTTLMNGLREGSDGWFEARVESMAVLAEIDRPRARATLDQYRVLYPDLGPEPFASRARELSALLSGVAPAAEPGTGGGG